MPDESRYANLGTCDTEGCESLAKVVYLDPLLPEDLFLCDRCAKENQPR